jgi:nicotinate-nucleotide adenylyltransferase
LRIALFGGAFDPIHDAHLRIAREAAERFALDRVLLIPAAHPPHKQARAPYEDRFRMVALAARGEPKLEASRLESGAEQNYSIDTIEKVRAALAPEDRLFFIIGADAFADIRTWKRWRDVAAAVEFIVVSRPGHEYEIPPEARALRLDALELPVSSSEIRARIAAGGEPAGVPPGVLRYIREKRLYSDRVHAPCREN